MIVDRLKRDALIETINRFLDGTTTAFQFDDELEQFRVKQADSTINDIAGTIWYFYDDCKDHKVRLTRQAWQYIQRLILVLHSDAHIIQSSTKIAHVTQLIAVISLMTFCYSMYYLGLGIQYFAIVIPFGIISIILSYFRKQLVNEKEKTDFNILPFSSFAELRALRHSVPQFAKRKYPLDMKTKRLRSYLNRISSYINTYIAWIIYAPIVLLFQSFRLKISNSRVSLI